MLLAPLFSVFEEPLSLVTLGNTIGRVAQLVVVHGLIAHSLYA